MTNNNEIAARLASDHAIILRYLLLTQFSEPMPYLRMSAQVQSSVPGVITAWSVVLQT